MKEFMGEVVACPGQSAAAVAKAVFYVVGCEEHRDGDVRVVECRYGNRVVVLALQRAVMDQVEFERVERLFGAVRGQGGVRERVTALWERDVDQMLVVRGASNDRWVVLHGEIPPVDDGYVD